MRKFIVGFVLVLSLLSAVAFAWQVSYDIPWWSVDGGVETSEGGDFSLSGITGQPDAGPVMTGGEFAVTGGYWHGGEETAPSGNDVFLPLLIR